jgi:hypothetical protein
MPTEFRLSEASLELCSEGFWWGSEKILLCGDGTGEWDGFAVKPEGRFQRRLTYSSDDFLGLLAEFYWAHFYSMGSNYLRHYELGGVSGDGTAGLRTSVVADATQRRLTLRLKDYTKAVSFFNGMPFPEFQKPETLDSLAFKVIKFAKKHAQMGEVEK